MAHHRSLLGERHGPANAVTIGTLGMAMHGPSLVVRVAMLVGALALLYVPLVRGRFREAFPKRQ